MRSKKQNNLTESARSLLVQGMSNAILQQIEENTDKETIKTMINEAYKICKKWKYDSVMWIMKDGHPIHEAYDFLCEGN